eukprot:5947596-Alexandrium_andersonii.AAC.1
MESWGVWDIRPISECLSRTGKKPIGGRWGRPQQRGCGVAKRAKSLCCQRHRVLQGRLHVRGNSSPRGAQTPSVRLGDPAPG